MHYSAYICYIAHEMLALPSIKKDKNASAPRMERLIHLLLHWSLFLLKNKQTPFSSKNENVEIAIQDIFKALLRKEDELHYCQPSTKIQQFWHEAVSVVSVSVVLLRFPPNRKFWCLQFYFVLVTDLYKLLSLSLMWLINVGDTYMFICI